jgi:hypothetical protein
LSIFVFALTGAFKVVFKMDIWRHRAGFLLLMEEELSGSVDRGKPVNWINDNVALILVFAGTAFTFYLKKCQPI